MLSFLYFCTLSKCTVSFYFSTLTWVKDLKLYFKFYLRNLSRPGIPLLLKYGLSLFLFSQDLILPHFPHIALFLCIFNYFVTRNELTSLNSVNRLTADKHKETMFCSVSISPWHGVMKETLRWSINIECDNLLTDITTAMKRRKAHYRA